MKKFFAVIIFVFILCVIFENDIYVGVIDDDRCTYDTIYLCMGGSKKIFSGSRFYFLLQEREVRVAKGDDTVILL